MWQQATGMMAGTWSWGPLPEHEAKKAKQSWCKSLNTQSPAPRDILPVAKPCSLNLSTQDHQLWTGCSNTRDHGGTFIIQTTIKRKKSHFICIQYLSNTSAIPHFTRKLFELKNTFIKATIYIMKVKKNQWFFYASNKHTKRKRMFHSQ